MTDGLYLDTSCLLKLVISEPESGEVEGMIAAETRVVISSLAELEAMVQLNGFRSGGTLSTSVVRRLRARLLRFFEMDPFFRCGLGEAAFETALLQMRQRVPHGRTLDRLHLAAMENLGLRRIMTNDDQQAVAARAMGFDVLLPRRQKHSTYRRTSTALEAFAAGPNHRIHP